MIIGEVKTGAEWKFDMAQLVAYMEMAKLNPSLESPGLERVEMKNKKGDTWHEYKKDGVTIPGVTTLLSLYRTWIFGDNAGKAAAERGSWIHRLIAKLDGLQYAERRYFLRWIENKLPLDHNDGNFAKDCILSYLKFLKDYGLEGVEVNNEVSLAGKGYAGTLDKIFMTPGPLKGYLLCLGKKYKAVSMTRRGYWMAWFSYALKVWQATNGKSKGFRQDNEKMEVNDDENKKGNES